MAEYPRGYAEAIRNIAEMRATYLREGVERRAADRAILREYVSKFSSFVRGLFRK